MASGYPPTAPEARSSAGRARVSARPDDAELLAPPEVDPVQLSRSMFSQPAPRAPPAPLTNQHLKKVARMDTSATSAEGAAAAADGGGSGGRSGGAATSRTRARGARSVAASSVRGGRANFSVISDEEVIDVDGAPTTLADDDMDLQPSPGVDPDEDEDEDEVPGGARHRGPNRAGNLGMSGIAGLAGDEYGGPDPLEELEADTPAVRLAEVTADLEDAKDPWAVVQLAQLALGHAKVVWRTMPVTVAEEPLLLANAHFALAKAYQGLGCDRQASDHGKQALAAIPKEVADTEAARPLRTEVQVMRAEALLSSAGVSGLPTDAACSQARKALVLLVKAAGLKEPVAWTTEEADDNELGGTQRDTIDGVADAGLVALMAQSHGVLAEAKLKKAEAEDTERKSSLRSADEAAARLDRRTDRGDAFYSAEQLAKYRGQVQAFRDEADNHQAEVVRLAGEAERSYDAAMYCLNHVIDVEGTRLENNLGREGKLSHATFRALWCRSLDFFSGLGAAYALQRKDAARLSNVNEILSVYAQYGNGGWLPPSRHIQALKDKGALLADRRDYEAATVCYEELTEVVTELYGNDPMLKELQVAEVLKLRGNVALAGGDFRTAQHMFNQALEFYQRHLGVQAPVAQDLLHRIDEVKGYLADTRVMGRLASLPPSRQATGSTPAAGSVAGGAGGSGAASKSPAPSVVMSARSSVSRPPPLSGPPSHRASSTYSTPATAPPPPPASGIRTSYDGDTAAAGSVAGGLSTASTPYSQALPTGTPTGASTPAYSQRAPSALGTPAAASRMSGASGSVRASGDGFTGVDAVAPGALPPASVAGSLRRGSASGLSGGSGWPGGAAAAAAAGPAPSVRSNRSGDMGGGGGGPGSVLSQRSYGGGGGGGGMDDAMSQRSGYGLDGMPGGMGSPAPMSMRSGAGGGLFEGGAASPAAMSQRSGFGSERGGHAAAASPAAMSQRSGFGGGGGGGSGGLFDGGAASPAAMSQRSGFGGGLVEGGGAASPAAHSHRSGAGGPASVTQSLRSADFTGRRGYGSTTGGTSQPRASGANIEDFADEAGDGAYGDDHASGVAPSTASATARRLLAAHSAELSGAVTAAFAPPSARSQRSGASDHDGKYGGVAASPSMRSQRSAAGYDGGVASPAALSHRSLTGFEGGTASPAALSQRSGFGGGGGYGSHSGGAVPAAALSQRSGEFGGLGKVNSRSSLARSNNDPMEM